MWLLRTAVVFGLALASASFGISAAPCTHEDHFLAHCQGLQNPAVSEARGHAARRLEARMEPGAGGSSSGGAGGSEDGRGDGKKKAKSGNYRTYKERKEMTWARRANDLKAVLKSQRDKRASLGIVSHPPISSHSVPFAGVPTTTTAPQFQPAWINPFVPQPVQPTRPRLGRPPVSLGGRVPAAKQARRTRESKDLDDMLAAKRAARAAGNVSQPTAPTTLAPQYRPFPQSQAHGLISPNTLAPHHTPTRPPQQSVASPIRLPSASIPQPRRTPTSSPAASPGRESSSSEWQQFLNLDEYD